VLGQCIFIGAYILGGRYKSTEAFKDLTPEIKHCKMRGTASDQKAAVSLINSSDRSK